MTPFLARIKTVCQLNSEWNVAEKIQSPSSIHFLSPSLFQLADHSTRRERERETSRVIVETNNSSRIHSIAHWPNRSQFHHFFRKANESSKVSGRSFQIHDTQIFIGYYYYYVRSTLSYSKEINRAQSPIDNGRSLSMEQRLNVFQGQTCTTIVNTSIG